jgi:hypothetical protein
MTGKTLADCLRENDGNAALAWKSFMGATDEHLALARQWIEEGRDKREGIYEHLLNHKPLSFGEAMRVAMFAYARGARLP